MPALYWIGAYIEAVNSRQAVRPAALQAGTERFGTRRALRRYLSGHEAKET